MRWRFNGTNWEGRFWTLTSGLQVLAQQVDARFPEGYVTDGTVAGKAHDINSPTSEHRPHPTAGAGIVRAIDIGIGAGEDAIFEQLRLARDPRIKYVIFNGRKFQGAPGSIGRPPWEWYTYTGANPHKTHGHISVWPTSDADSSPWNLGGGDNMLTPEQEKFVKDMFAAASALGSNGGFVTQAIEDIREKNAAGGYYAKNQPLPLPPAGGGLNSGDTVQLVKV